MTPHPAEGTLVSIRLATAADVPHIEQIVNDAYAPYISRIGRAPAPMNVDYQHLVATTSNASVLVENSSIVGVIVTVAAPDHLMIENVAVARTAQARGHGRTLLEHAERQARALGLVQIRLYTNAAMTENLAMYPRIGYVEVARRSEDGFERVYFAKDL
jgi:ribosomal protein S18 acetylase RimI-like enzyme